MTPTKICTRTAFGIAGWAAILVGCSGGNKANNTSPAGGVVGSSIRFSATTKKTGASLAAVCKLGFQVKNSEGMSQ